MCPIANRHKGLNNHTENSHQPTSRKKMSDKVQISAECTENIIINGVG
ncbi:MAG: hypothetical protein AB8B46_01420 [Candidatus Midichloriaceae bacterium]